MYQIILASGSPRRKEILEQVGVSFTTMTSDVEEVSDKTDAIEIVEDLASMKAMDVANKVKGPAIILGADTLVVHNDTILGKPANEQEAKKMLLGLANDSHEVYTGVCIILKDIEAGGKKYQFEKISFADVSKVIVLPMNNAQIEQYIATKEPLDKAGGYAIQGRFAVYIKEIIGDYYNVVGLPISKVHRALYEHGIDLLK